MVKDRMTEFQAEVRKRESESDANSSATAVDVDSVGIALEDGAAVYVRTNGLKNPAFEGDNNNAGADEYLEDFFHLIEEMRGKVEVMKSRSVEMKKLTANLLLQTDRAKYEQERELDSLVAEVKKMGGQVKNKLKLMETMVDKKPPQAGTYVSAEQRIKKMHFTMITKEFCDVMNEINASQTNYQEKLKEKMVKQLRVMNPEGTDYTNDQINEMIDSGKTDVFTQNLLMETEDARAKLSAVQARHDEIVKLEKSILEVHDMFLDLAVLVESQGVMINNIEDNVLKTADYVSTAVCDIGKAVELKSAFNKKRCICIVIGIVALAIIAIILAVEFAPKAKD